MKFCGECGTGIGGAEAGTSDSSNAATSPPERDPREYTPRHLADKILQSKSALEGERKQVTILFADVRGSMALSEELGAEEWHEVLDRFFQILTEGVHRFEGRLQSTRV